IAKSACHIGRVTRYGRRRDPVRWFCPRPHCSGPSSRAEGLSMSESTAAPGAPWFLQAGGESGAVARAIDWSSTPLGSPDTWPSMLKTTVATILRARQPMFLWWGEELIQLYNDAYLPSFNQGKHPRAMGQR